MKKWSLALLVVCVVITGLYLIFNTKKNPVSTTQESPSITSSTQQSSTAQPSIAQNNPADALVASSSASPATSPALAERAAVVPPPAAAPENLPPAIVLENVRRALRQYGALFGGNPVGTNPEITAELNGHNPKQINFIQPEAGMRINDQAELVDAWGTPLFFHQISGTETEIHSAGPDKIMWTHDDVITK